MIECYLVQEIDEDDELVPDTEILVVRKEGTKLVPVGRYVTLEEAQAAIARLQMN